MNRGYLYLSIVFNNNIHAQCPKLSHQFHTSAVQSVNSQYQLYCSIVVV